MGTSRYSLRTVTVPSGPFVVLVEWLPPTDACHLIVAAGFPSAASHWATTTDLEPAWTVTALAEFLGLARGTESEQKQKCENERRGVLNVGSQRKLSIEGKRTDQ